MAIKYYKMALNNGIIVAAMNIAIIYHVFLKNINKAVKYLSIAYSKGFFQALITLWKIHEDEYNDITTAINYYELAIMNNVTDGYFSLARLYHRIEKFDKAIENYTEAEKKGNVFAYVYIGDIYLSHHNNQHNAIKYYNYADTCYYENKINNDDLPIYRWKKLDPKSVKISKLINDINLKVLLIIMK